MSGLVGDELVEVRILGLPIQAQAQAQEHVDGLLREFTLLTAGVRQGVDHVPARLLALVEELQRDYEGLTTDQDAELVDAAEAGAAALDLTYRVPPEAAEACARLSDELDAADEYCRAGEHLLTMGTPSEALAFRRWYLGEFVAQIAGRPPRSWPEWVADGDS